MNRRFKIIKIMINMKINRAKKIGALQIKMISDTNLIRIMMIKMILMISISTHQWTKRVS